MNRFFKAVVIGTAAGILDAIALVLTQSVWQSSLAALLHWMCLGILITYIRLPFTGWFSGILVALMTGVPLAILSTATETGGAGHFIFTSIILGGLLGLIAEKLIVNQLTR
ncbi:hypothetical protein [Pseudodesulfovibrio sp.]|uniref:hypothetical protein n=1 Tax=unclassified Pseudodesulfovibrio TaxID=2661612 RepID=UPI003B00C1EA